MLNFRDNFFFAKFTVLFFILTIFGYWGIDLNSEELYIAFSFFLLVIIGVILSRKSILTLFVKSVNTKYFRLLTDLVIISRALTLQQNILEYLWALNAVVAAKINRLMLLVTDSYFDETKIAAMFNARAAVLNAFFRITARIFAYRLGGMRKYFSFKKFASNSFTLTI